MNIDGIIIEVLEVFLNQILYMRELYPAQIFKRRRVFNTPVQISIYPTLNTYLYKVLSSAKELAQKQQLQCVELRIYKNTEENTIEQYKFLMKTLQPVSKNRTLPVSKNDEFLVTFEEKIRASLYLMGERLKDLDKLPSEANFKIRLYTTQQAFHQLTSNPHQQDFPWLRGEPDQKTLDKVKYLLPLTNLSHVGLEVFAEL